MLLIGLDEAGYGPRVGPLCHGYCAVRLPDPPEKDSPPDLFELLHPTVMRYPANQDSVIVDDSKKVYSTAQGADLLHRSVKAFLECIKPGLDARIDKLTLEHLIPESDCTRLEEDSWGCVSLPPCESNNAPPQAIKKSSKAKKTSSTSSESGAAISCLKEVLSARGVSVLAIGARALSAKHFNRALRTGENKADINWNVIASQFATLLDHALPGEAVHAWIDRQGGRKFYTGKLGDLFPGAMPWVELETAQASVYRIEYKGRTIRVAFLVNADGLSMPVALASMAAKLTRELCMERFNHFFKSHIPTLKPTACYYGDAQRFLIETRPIRKKLQIQNRELVRLR